MTPNALVAPALFVVFPLTAATWILGGNTIGKAIKPNDPVLIGFALALLVFSASSYLLLLRPAPDKPDARLGMVLAASGGLCILAALGLQFYVASIAADSSRRAAEIVADRMKANQPQVNVNVSANVPDSVHAIGYLALLAGVWLVLLGARFGVGRAGPAPEASAFRESPALERDRLDMPPTGIRPLQ